MLFLTAIKGFKTQVPDPLSLLFCLFSFVFMFSNVIALVRDGCAIYEQFFDETGFGIKICKPDLDMLTGTTTTLVLL